MAHQARQRPSAQAAGKTQAQGGSASSGHASGSMSWRGSSGTAGRPQQPEKALSRRRSHWSTKASGWGARLFGTSSTTTAPVDQKGHETASSGASTHPSAGSGRRRDSAVSNGARHRRGENATVAETQSRRRTEQHSHGSSSTGEAQSCPTSLSLTNMAEARPDSLVGELSGGLRAAKRQREDASWRIEAYRARLAALPRPGLQTKVEASRSVDDEDKDEPYSSYPALVAFAKDDRNSHAGGVYYDLLQVSSSSSPATRSALQHQSRAAVKADPCEPIHPVFDHATHDLSAKKASSSLGGRENDGSVRANKSAGCAASCRNSSTLAFLGVRAWSGRQIARLCLLGVGMVVLVACLATVFCAGKHTCPTAAAFFVRRTLETGATATPRNSRDPVESPAAFSSSSSSGAAKGPRSRKTMAPSRSSGRESLPTAPPPAEDPVVPAGTRVAVVSSNFGGIDVLSAAPRQRGVEHVSFFLFSRHRDFLASLRGWTLVLPSRMAAVPGAHPARGKAGRALRRRRHLEGGASAYTWGDRDEDVFEDSFEQDEKDHYPNEEDSAGRTPSDRRRTAETTRGAAGIHSQRGEAAYPTVVYSRSWDAALERINRGKRRRNHVARGAYPPTSRALTPLPFDLESLEHTRRHGIGPEYEDAQNLVDVMAPKFVKLQMFRIDVLRPFGYLVWADASLVFDDGAVYRAMRPLLRRDADLVLQPHPKRNSTFEELKHILEVQSQERFIPIAPYLRDQMAFYENSTETFTDSHGLYWMAYFGAKRTNRSIDFFDRWWLEVRRWQYRDQVSVMFALNSVPVEDRPRVTSFDVDKACCKSGHKRLPPEQVLCVTLVGDHRRCCRRCSRKVAAPPSSATSAVGSSTSAATSAVVPIRPYGPVAPSVSSGGKQTTAAQSGSSARGAFASANASAVS